MNMALLCYTCVEYTSINFYLQHWFVSGNVHCFHNWHAPLAILAIFTLIFCVSIVVIIVIYALHWMEVSYFVELSRPC